MKQEPSNTIYGINAVTELLNNRINEIDRIYFDSGLKGKRTFQLLKEGRRKKIQCQCIPAQKLDKIAGTLKHQGIVALCSKKPYDTMDVLYRRIDETRKPPVILVPASIEDPRNFGAIIRSSVAFDVFALLVERKKTAPLNSTVAKTSAGMLEYISIVKPCSLEKEIRFLGSKGFSIFGLRNKNDKRLDKVDFTKPCVIITGGEYKGIPQYLKKLCTDLIGIPVTQYTDSLNVSVAVSIILYEISKQRNFKFDK